MSHANQNTNSALDLFLKAFFILMPFGVPLFARLVPSDFFILAASFSIFFSHKRKNLKLCRLDGLFLIFLGVSVFGKEAFFYPRSFIFEVSSIIFLYFSLRIVSSEIPNEEKLESFLNLLRISFIAMLAVNTVAIFFKLAGFKLFNTILFNPTLRLKGAFSLPNQLGITILLLAPIVFYKGTDGLVKRMLIFSMMLLNTTEIGARGIFWISIMEIAIIELFIFKEVKLKKNLLKMLVLSVTVVTVFCILSGEFSLKRSLGQIKNFPMAYDESRISTFRKAVNTMPDWLTGYGLGCFKNNHPFEIHNLPISILVETGIFGFSIALIGYILSTLHIFIRQKVYSIPNFYPCFKMSILVGLTIGMLHNITTNRCFWLILTISYAVSNFKTLENDRRDVLKL